MEHGKVLPAKHANDANERKNGAPGGRPLPGTCLARPRPVAQAFQPAGSRNFLVPRGSRMLERGTGKSPEPADRNVCATALNRYPTWVGRDVLIVPPSDSRISRASRVLRASSVFHPWLMSATESYGGSILGGALRERGLSNFSL